MHSPTQSSPSKNVLSPPVDQAGTVDPVQAVRASPSAPTPGAVSTERVALALDAVFQIGALSEALHRDSEEVDARLVDACSSRVLILCDAICQALDPSLGNDLSATGYLIHGVHREYAEVSHV